jgi:hypothetical protein
VRPADGGYPSITSLDLAITSLDLANEKID